MLYWLRRLFSNREDIAEKCSGKGAEISARSVSRCLKALTDKGLLQRAGNGYAPTEQAKEQPRQDTLN
jgi:repressor of nif and glnA expression